MKILRGAESLPLTIKGYIGVYVGMEKNMKTTIVLQDLGLISTPPPPPPRLPSVNFCTAVHYTLFMEIFDVGGVWGF